MNANPPTQSPEARRALYEQQATIPLAECTLVDQSKAEHPGWQVTHNGVDVASDYILHPVYEKYTGGRGNCYLVIAWKILDGKVEKERTVGLLRTLRQAVRETIAQGSGVEIPPESATIKQIRIFIREARRADAIHHGGNTF